MNKVIQEDPELSALLHFAAAMDGTTGHIEASEDRGQQHLVNSAQLPAKGTPGGPDGYRKTKPDDWAAMGIEFGPIVEGDIFRDATLPEGWKVEATDHAMWSKLLDDKGRERASIFYKAAFYDREAHIDLCSRFTVRSVYNESPKWTGQDEVLDGGERVFITPEVDAAKLEELNDHSRPYEERDKESKAIQLMCEEWLSAKGFGDYRNPAIYWDATL